ncbi:MAG TPA: hypothetical protein VFQ61_26545, partial [Polyangiaceae bacterium]|nr:hypothetical protein [Polyangiaceae bacterium]
MSLASYVLMGITALPTFHEDVGDRYSEQKRIQAETIATAIAEVAEKAQGWPGTPRELASLLLTVAWHETRLSLRIHEGNCRPFECDHGRARGLWQLHMHASLPRERWLTVAGLDPDSTRAAAQEAARALIRSRRMCMSVSRGADWVPYTLVAFAGRGCRGQLPDIQRRVRTFHHLVAIEPKKNGS